MKTTLISLGLLLSPTVFPANPISPLLLFCQLKGTLPAGTDMIVFVHYPETIAGPYHVEFVGYTPYPNDPQIATLMKGTGKIRRAVPEGNLTLTEDKIEGSTAKMNFFVIEEENGTVRKEGILEFTASGQKFDLVSCRYLGQ